MGQGGVKRPWSDPIVLIIGLAFVVFAVWQVMDHFLLMEAIRLSMFPYHLIALFGETTGAAIVGAVVARALVRKNRELEDLSRLKDMLTSSLVHDLRQPLSALLGGLSLAEHDSSLPDRTREVISLAHLGGDQLLQMVNDLLDISRLEAGQPLVRGQPLAAADFVRAGLRPVAQLATEKGVELALDLPENLPQVQGDEERLSRVVTNLVGNALRFTPSGGRVEVSARTEAASGRLLVSVSDTGSGIPKEAQGRVFEKFAVLEQAGPTGRTSTGLGLTFCKMIVEAHGGRIWVESEPGRGSTFAFALPVLGVVEGR